MRMKTIKQTMTTPPTWRRGLAGIVLAGFWAAAGCVPSVYPLYTERDLEFEPALVGAWVEEKPDEDSSRWVFERRDDKSYRLTIHEKEKKSPFVAHLVRLDRERFLDLCPEPDGLEDLPREDLFKAALIRGHLFLKVKTSPAKLELAFMDPEWLEARLKEQPSALGHLKPPEGGLVLTASTRDLQKFVRRHAGTAKAWGEPGVLVRKSQ